MTNLSLAHELSKSCIDSSFRSPVGGSARYEARAAVADLRALRQKAAERREQHPVLTAADLKSLIEEGRR